MSLGRRSLIAREAERGVDQGDQVAARARQDRVQVDVVRRVGAPQDRVGVGRGDPQGFGDRLGEGGPAAGHAPSEDQLALVDQGDLGRAVPNVQDQAEPGVRLVAQEPVGVRGRDRLGERPDDLAAGGLDPVDALLDPGVLRQRHQDLVAAAAVGHHQEVRREGLAGPLGEVGDLHPHDQVEAPVGHGRQVRVANDRVLPRDPQHDRARPDPVLTEPVDHGRGEPPRPGAGRRVDQLVTHVVAEVDQLQPAAGEADRGHGGGPRAEVQTDADAHRSPPTGGSAARRFLASITPGTSSRKVASTNR